MSYQRVGGFFDDYFSGGGADDFVAEVGGGGNLVGALENFLSGLVGQGGSALDDALQDVLGRLPEFLEDADEAQDTWKMVKTWMPYAAVAGGGLVMYLVLRK